MGSTRSAQQAHRDAVNIQRMLYRLEAATEKEQHAPSTSYATLKDYYKIMSTLTSIKHAKKLLDESVSDDRTRNDLAHRLDQLESHYKVILEHAPKPQPSSPPASLEHLRPAIPPLIAENEPAQESTVLDTNLPTPEAQAAENLLSLGDEDPHTTGVGSGRRHSSFDGVPDSITPLSSINSARPTIHNRTSSRSYNQNNLTSSNRSDTPPTTQSLSNLLSHHRSEQESLTEELATMASRLKMNSLEFSQLLEKDKGLLENAEQQLDGNLTGMIKERDRLKAYKKTGGVTTWFVIGAVLVVLLAWLFMFALMRIF